MSRPSLAREVTVRSFEKLLPKLMVLCVRAVLCGVLQTGGARIRKCLDQPLRMRVTVSSYVDVHVCVCAMS